ncbi:MAG: recombination mediator RecR [Fibrobacterota bacterium]
MDDSLTDLVDALRLLPAVGEKSAWRMAMYLLDHRQEQAPRLAGAITAAVEKLHPCPSCNTWTEDERCSVCASPRRDRSVLCIVERPRDMWTIERSGSFRGLYHVLGGLISPMKGISVRDVFLDSFVDRVRREEIEEIIIGLGGSSEAETTFHYILKLLDPVPGVRVSRFARGLSAGMDIDYADKRTLVTALGERRQVHYSGGRQ